MDPNQIRRQLMAERQDAVVAGDWARMNALTKRIADLPMPGVPALTQRDIDKYRKGRAA